MNGSLGTMPPAPKTVATATQQDQKNYKLMRAATPFFWKCDSGRPLATGETIHSACPAVRFVQNSLNGR